MERGYNILGGKTIAEIVAPKLKWTKEKPTEHGWYWMKSKNLSPRIVRIYFDSNNIMRGDWIWKDPEEFAGPIEQPETKE